MSAPAATGGNRDLADVSGEELLDEGSEYPIGNVNTQALCLLVAQYIDEQIRLPITMRTDTDSDFGDALSAQGTVLSLKEALRRLVANEYGSRGSVGKKGLDFVMHRESTFRTTPSRTSHVCESLCVVPYGWSDYSYTAAALRHVFGTTSGLNGVLLLLKEVWDVRRAALYYKEKYMKALATLNRSKKRERAEVRKAALKPVEFNMPKLKACTEEVSGADADKVLEDMDGLIVKYLKGRGRTAKQMYFALVQCHEIIRSYCKRTGRIPVWQPDGHISREAGRGVSNYTTFLGDEEISTLSLPADPCGAEHGPTITITSGDLAPANKLLPHVPHDSADDIQNSANAAVLKKRATKKVQQPLPLIRVNPLSQPPCTPLSCDPTKPVVQEKKNEKFKLRTLREAANGLIARLDHAHSQRKLAVGGGLCSEVSGA